MTLIEAKQKLLYYFVQLAKETETDFILCHPEASLDEKTVLHIFILAEKLKTLEEALAANQSLSQELFWQDAISENSDYLLPVHTPHLCLNGTTWSVPVWEDLPIHQGIYLVLHPLSYSKSSGWSAFWQKNRYYNLQKKLWKEAWQEQSEQLKVILPQEYSSRVLANRHQIKGTLAELLAEKQAYLTNKVGDCLVYYDLWGLVSSDAKFNLPIFQNLAKLFQFLREPQTFTAFVEQSADVAALNWQQELAQRGVSLPRIEIDLEPLEVDSVR